MAVVFGYFGLRASDLLPERRAAIFLFLVRLPGVFTSGFQ